MFPDIDAYKEENELEEKLLAYLEMTLHNLNPNDIIYLHNENLNKINKNKIKSNIINSYKLNSFFSKLLMNKMIYYQFTKN